MTRTESCIVVVSLLAVGCGPKVLLPEADTDSDNTSISGTRGDDQDGDRGDDQADDRDDRADDDGPVTSDDGPGDGPAPTSVGPSDDSVGSFTASSLSESGVLDDASADFDVDSGSPELPDGSSCNEDFECSSGHCFVLGPLGGICGACSNDADCDGGGCTPPNPLVRPPEPSFCNMGGLGEACGSDQVCNGDLVCMDVFVVPGVYTLSGCSECDASNDCNGNERCDPNLEFAEQTGYWECVALGSQPLGAVCDASGNGQVCASGHCATASLMGLAELGVCSECESDQDCPGGGPCTAPELAMGGPIPGTCQ